MAMEERAALHALELPLDSVPDARMTELSYADCAIQEPVRGVASGDTKYLDLSFLTPTSNMCERLFSKAGHALSDRRRGLSPASFESQIFLHVNRDLWGASDFVTLMRNRSDA